MIERSLLEQAAAAVAGARRLALACHVGPDGDALGSMLGFGVAAANAGKEVVASFGSPYLLPSSFDFLPTDLLVAPDDFPERPEVMVVFDVGSADRLAELGSPATDAGTLIVIDHHVTNTGFGHHRLVDPQAAASAVIVADLLRLLRWPITPEVATCLLTALVTDTGRFQYQNTTPSTLRLAAGLAAAGARPAEIGRKVYEEAPFGYLKVAGKVLERAELDPALGVVSSVVTEEDLRTAGIDWGDMENLIDTIRLAEEADVAVLVKVHDDGRVKVSLRSRGGTDVGGLAAELGGGGHRLASGLTYQGSAEEALAEVLQRVGGYR